MEAFLAGQLQGADAQEAIPDSHAQVGLAVSLHRTHGQAVCTGQFFGFENLQHHGFLTGLMQLGPGSRIGCQAPDKVINLLEGPVPVDAAGILEYLGGRTQGFGRRHLLLRNGSHAPCQDGIHGLHHYPAAQLHQPVVHRARIVRIGNRHALLTDDLARVYLVLQEKSSDTGLCIAVDDGPVDRRRTAVLGQKGGVQVERAQAGHGPHHLGQHPEGNDHLQVGPPGAELREEGFVLQLLGLQQGQAVCQGVLLDGRLLQPMAASGRFVGHGDDTHYVVAALHQAAQGLHRKVGCAHIDDSQVFFLHIHIYLVSISKELEGVIAPSGGS